ncbi:MAG: DoxX family protein [Pseudonocardiales bacterium]|nr:DoxX family protein [Pseudonocardiales bacterium]
MNTAVWICQAVMAALFLASGSAKISMPRDRLLATGQTGITPFPMPVVRATAVAELLAAVGLIVPWASGVVPMLTPLAAVGLAAVMVGAAGSHLHLREPLTAGANMVILVVCVLIAVARFTGH